MRNLAFALIAANLLYFAWTYWGVHDKPMLVAVPASAQPVRAKPAAAPPCATLGPFLDETMAERAGGQLTGAGMHAQRRDTTAQVHEGWWVYVASADAAARQRALEAIRRAGQRDAFAMPDDPAFRVSVGVFSDQQKAADLAARLQGTNLAAAVEERIKDQPEIWFDLPGMTPEALGDGRLENLDLPLLDLTVEACREP
jgi:hypothetical protein